MRTVPTVLMETQEPVRGFRSRVWSLWVRNCMGAMCRTSAGNRDYDELSDGMEGTRCQNGTSRADTSDDHCHLPKTSNQGSRQAITKLLIACCFTTLFMVSEVIGGYFANSIAIMSDAAHMFSDLTSFIVSLVAIYLAMRPASRKMNFGYHRAEVLGAVISVLMIWVITGMLVYAAIQRIISMDFEVEADIMIIVSAVGVVMNIILGIVLHSSGGGHGHSHSHGLGSNRAHSDSSHSHGRPPPPAATNTRGSNGSQVNVSIGGNNSDIVSNHSHTSPSITAHSGSSPATGNSSTLQPPPPASSGHGHSHNGNINMRAAFIHVIGDLVQSIGVLIAAYIIRFYPEYKIADPICTFLFSVLVILTTVPIIRDLGRVLMEGVPPGVDYEAMSAHLAALPGVKTVHSLHVWSLTVDKNACSVHLAVGAECDSDAVLRAAQRVIRSRHHIFHTTIQVETYNQQLMDNCNQCQPLL